MCCDSPPVGYDSPCVAGASPISPPPAPNTASRMNSSIAPAPTAGCSADMLSQARTGCPHSLGLALDAHRPALLNIALVHFPPGLRAKGDAADVVQDALLDA